mgnify:CR=1 FL=1
MLYMWCNSLGDTNGNPKLGFNAARSILCGATPNRARAVLYRLFQCRTQHFMWCNRKQKCFRERLRCFNAARSILCGATQLMCRPTRPEHVSMPHAAFYVVQPRFAICSGGSLVVSMPHAAFYVVQQTIDPIQADPSKFQCRTQHFMWCNPLVRKGEVLVAFQCRTQHFMWCNNSRAPHRDSAISFNAARSILCGATARIVSRSLRISLFQCRTQHFMWCNLDSRHKSLRRVVSMPHAAFYVVQHKKGVLTMMIKVSMPHAAFYVVQPRNIKMKFFILGFNAARSILCGATRLCVAGRSRQRCFNAARSILCGATDA